MKTRLLLLIGLAVIVSRVSADTIFSSDFTQTEGFVEGGSINQISGWESQDGFLATDTAAAGLVSAQVSWMRARNNVAFLMERGDRIILTANLQFSITAGGGEPVLGLGISDASSHIGENIPAIPFVIHVYPQGVSFGDGKANKLWFSMDTVKDDTVRLTATLMKSATADVFDITIALYNVTDGTVVGRGSWSTEDSASWNATVFRAAMRSMNMNGLEGRIYIDSLKLERFAPSSDVKFKGLGGYE